MRKYSYNEIEEMRKIVFKLEKGSFPESDSYPDYPAEHNWGLICEEKLRTYLLASVSPDDLRKKLKKKNDWIKG